MDFSNALVAGIPLVLVVIGLVEWFKKMGLAGVWLNVASLAIGLVAGISYQVSLAVPVDFAGWFGAVVYGLGLGLVASGLYDAVRNATTIEVG